MNSEILSILSSGRISYGPKSQWFERAFADSHHCDHGIISNSGTSALLVALEACRDIGAWEPESEVIVPALTFVASVNAITQAGLKPVLVDVNPYTYVIDETKIEKAITDKTVAIMPVHLFGRPCNMDIIGRIATHYNLGIIEDCCEAFGAKYKQTPVGSFGSVGCFSTYVGHHIVTGVGGMCLTNDPLLAKIMRSYVNHGLSVSQLPTGLEYDPSMLGRIFQFDRIGHSFRTTELEAAIGIHQLTDWPKKIAMRRENATVYNRYLSGIRDISIPNQLDPVYFHSFMVYPILIKNGAVKASVLMEHLRENGIECRSMMPLTNQPCYDFDEDQWPYAKYINEYGFYIGCHEYLSKDHIEYAAKIIKDYFFTG